MKILVSADIHSQKNVVDKITVKAKKEKVDLIISAGDLSIFGRSLKNVLEDLNKIGVPVLVIPGNHEEPEEFFELCEEYENIVNLHQATYEFGDFIFVGFGNPGFSLIEPDFDKFAFKIKNKLKGKKVILITHGPPFDTKLDYLDGEHVGCKSFNTFIANTENVILAVSGHIHENFHIEDKIEKTKIVNPGPLGKVLEL